MTSDERVEQELTQLRKQFSKHEWFTLGEVVKQSLQRIAANACCGHCDCLDNACPVHGINAERTREAADKKS